MKGRITAILLSISILAFGQIDTGNNYSEFDSTEVFAIVEEIPVFLRGGDKGLMQIISDSLNYPITARRDGVQGRVIAQFTVDTTGNLIDISIAEGVREDIDNEALRLIGLLNGWKPGVQNNKKVKVRYSIPLYFSLDYGTRKKKAKNGTK